MKNAASNKPIFSVFNASAEPELAGERPRRLRRRPGKGQHPIVAAVMLLFMLPGFGFLLRAVLLTLALWFGVWVPGTVTERRSDANDEGVTYALDFDYALGAQQFSSGVSLRGAVYRAIPDDAPLRVRVWTPLPEWSAVPFWQGRALGISRLEMLAFAIVWLSVTATPFYAGFFKSLEDRQLVRHGTPIAVRITRKETKDDDPTTYHLHYEFITDGKTWNGEVKVQSDEFESVEEGESSTILFNPKHPEINTLYRFAHYRAK